MQGRLAGLLLRGRDHHRSIWVGVREQCVPRSGLRSERQLHQRLHSGPMGAGLQKPLRRTLRRPVQSRRRCVPKLRSGLAGHPLHRRADRVPRALPRSDVHARRHMRQRLRIRVLGADMRSSMRRALLGRVQPRRRLPNVYGRLGGLILQGARSFASGPGAEHRLSRALPRRRMQSRWLMRQRLRGGLLGADM